jgi:hypothetical protein
MTTGTIAEAIEAVLKEKADRVEVYREAHQISLKAYVGKQLFTISCREEEKDDGAPAIT